MTDFQSRDRERADARDRRPKARKSNRSPTITRYLGIDYGARRVGLAVGDSDGSIAAPVALVQSSGDIDDLCSRIRSFADDYDVDAFVVGLPLNMDDSEGPQAKLCRRFGQALQQLTGRTVHYFDERLTSLSADDHLVDAQLTRGKKKARRDAVAAQLMLQSFLDAQDK